MGIVAKAAAGVVGAGTIAAGGVGINHLMNMEPKVITLKDTKMEKPAAGKWWESYSDKDNLVSNDSDNESWWNWSYKHSFLSFKSDSKSSELDEHFKATKQGYSSANESPKTSLNQLCWEAYGKEKNDITQDGNLQKNIKAFCSVETKKGK